MCAMRRNSRHRGHPLPAFSRKEFDAWVGAQHHFDALWTDYEASGFEKMKRPSVDRLDNSRPYSFDNMRLVTWEENRRAWDESAENKAIRSRIGKVTGGRNKLAALSEGE